MIVVLAPSMLLVLLDRRQGGGKKLETLDDAKLPLEPLRAESFWHYSRSYLSCLDFG